MSVLETPRIYFRGEISWDPITTNNYDQNYNEQSGEPIYPPDIKQIVPTTADQVKAFRESAIREVVTLQSWNPHGTHRSSFFNTTVCGYDLGQGLVNSGNDPFLSVPVNLTGMLVDLEPFGGFTSQLFFDRMDFGIDGGCRIAAPRTWRFTDRYVNMARTTYPAFHAGIASVIWQTSFLKAGLQLDSFDSIALQTLAVALEDEDVLGLTVRFNTYRTIYYNKLGLTNRGIETAEEAQRLVDKLNGGGFQPNPARSLVVGVFGLWRQNEPPLEPGDRVMAQAQNSPTASAFARVVGSNLVMDFGNSISETSIECGKQDLGTLGVVAVDPQTDAVTPLGFIEYSQYYRDAYEATAGIVTVPLPQGPLPDFSTQVLQLQDATGAPLLTELTLRAIPAAPNFYLDEGESSLATFQVYDRGVPLAVDLVVPVYQLDAAGGTVVNKFVAAAQPNGVLSFALKGDGGTISVYVPVLSSAEITTPNGLNPQVNTYMYLRVRPADNFVASLAPTWTNVYAHVLANWKAMAPCMDNWLKLDDPNQVRAFAPLIKHFTDPANFENYRFMPVTRDMSVGERTLLYNFLAAPVAERAQEMATAVPSTRSFAQRSRAMRRGSRE